ncbi:hypothetical protein EI77_00286 [Prosthecobacter fusiformis]|uniref:Uncharacterized protein n=1 Tax=Prosthecobacter fusiformis TaxID=48464 RepID=A0A4R7SPZ0_9BACT|nr:hypothetical protein [Prosthecobacter fusiformis]TDU80984.1 hypothetical protein EI77_00286 [Prosthecobacter fusiformis]
MSLKHFHIVFLFFAILSDLGFWLWTRMLPEQAAALGVAGLGSFAGWLSIVMTAYGVWYIFKKSRTIIV